jgi:hypothetical protein
MAQNEFTEKKEEEMAPYDFTKEARETDEVLAKDIRKLEGLTDEKITELLPQQTDRDHLKELIRHVSAEADLNRKKEVLNNRLATVSEAVKLLVKGFIKVAI